MGDMDKVQLMELELKKRWNLRLSARAPRKLLCTSVSTRTKKDSLFWRPASMPLGHLLRRWPRVESARILTPPRSCLVTKTARTSLTQTSSTSPTLCNSNTLIVDLPLGTPQLAN